MKTKKNKEKIRKRKRKIVDRWLLRFCLLFACIVMMVMNEKSDIETAEQCHLLPTAYPVSSKSIPPGRFSRLELPKLRQGCVSNPYIFLKILILRPFTVMETHPMLSPAWMAQSLSTYFWDKENHKWLKFTLALHFIQRYEMMRPLPLGSEPPKPAGLPADAQRLGRGNK